MVKVIVIALILLVGFTSWLVPKFLQAEKPETPCVRLIFGFYYCGQQDVIEKYLDKVKTNPNFQF